MHINLKTKMLLFTTFVVSLFALLIVYISFLENSKYLLFEKNEEYQKTLTLFELVTKDQEKKYSEYIEFMKSSSKLMKAFENKNSLQLQRLLAVKYKLLTKLDKNINAIEFHTTEGRVLASSGIVAHKNRISITRSSIYEVHKSQKRVSGFELFDGELLFRIIEPIYSNAKYIGALELRVQSTHLLQTLCLYSGFEAALLVDRKSSIGHVGFKDYEVESKFFKDLNLLEYLDHDFDFEKHTDIETNKKKHYTIYCLNLEDKLGKVNAKILLFDDRSLNMKSMNEEIKLLIFLNLGGVILIFFLLRYVFNHIILTFEKKLEYTQEYKRVLNRSLITFSIDLNGHIIEASDAFCKISGYNKEEVLRNKNNILDHYYIINSIKHSKTWSGELEQLHKNRTNYWVHAIVQPRFQEKSLIGCDVVMYDITQEKLNENLLTIDKLTNIYNRKHFKKTLPRVINNTKRYGGYLSLLIIDIDRFKQYNDKYGNKRGDETLISIASTLEKSLKRSSDYCFRLGGDEFGVIFNSENSDDAVVFAEKIKKSIEALAIKHLYNTSKSIVTVSLGLVTLKDSDLVEDDMMYYIADENLYKAKSSGRNQIVYS